jgi:hypothetical protein
MSGSKQIRIRGKQRAPIDVDLLAQLLGMLGRQLAREATADGMPAATNARDADLAALLAVERQKATEVDKADDIAP